MSTTTTGERAEEQVRISVRALRSARGVSAKAICERLKVSRAAYFTRMNGATSFTAGEVAELAELFGAAVEDLYSGHITVGPMPTPPSGTNEKYLSGERLRLVGSPQVTPLPFASPAAAA